jgi:ketosteroid isomerase-like protein
MKANNANEKAIQAVLEEFAESYAKQDLKTVLALIAPDDDVVMYGTSADEKCIGFKEIKAQFESDWSQIEAPALEYKWTSISAAGNVAWVAIDAVFKARVNGQNLSFPSRVTKVLEKRGDKWLIVHAHFSFPDGSQISGK